MEDELVTISMVCFQGGPNQFIRPRQCYDISVGSRVSNSMRFLRAAAEALHHKKRRNHSHSNSEYEANNTLHLPNHPGETFGATHCPAGCSRTKKPSSI